MHPDPSRAPAPGRKAPGSHEEILVIGAGIAGLAAALALAGAQFRITLLDRDPPPPATSPDEAFAHWQRKGVGHVRHSHAFLAVLYQLLRDRHPKLLEELLAAGCRELTFAESLPATLRAGYVPDPADRDLTILTSRRTTLEYVIRNHVAGLGNVTIETGVRVRDLVLKESPAGTDVPPRVRGVMAETDDAPLAPRLADLVIDASGRLSQVPAWLAARGIRVPETTAPCGIVYYTRHYRLNPGMDEPARGRVPGAGDLGYLKYGVFPGDNGCFSITLAVPEIETGLRQALVAPESFDAACRALPGLAPWIDPQRARPASRVLGMGRLESRWRRYVVDGRPLVTHFFALGDAAVRTNPLYGRGCSCAFVEAQALADALSATADPLARARAYADAVEREIRPYYDNMVRQDRAAIRRAQREIDPTRKRTLKGRIMASFADDAITPALRASVALLREAMKGFHMLEPPADWLKRPANLMRVLAMWLTPRPLKRHLYPPRLGPDRLEMHTHLGARPALPANTGALPARPGR